MALSPSPHLGGLRVENLENPLGLDEPVPRFSWRLFDGRIGAGQTAWQLEVRVDGALFWDSGRVVSPESVLVPYAGPALRPHTRHAWRARVWDHQGKPVAWSEPARFETGFLAPEKAWPAAKWIRLPLPETESARPAPCLRKGFRLGAAPRSARLYVTARGLFEAHLNGERVGRDRLTPGWTDYRHRLEYLTYDVTARLVAGDNVLGAMLSDGWHSGSLGWVRERDNYGRAAFLAVLRIEEPDGAVRWIGTDETWQGRVGPILGADLYDGETYDARRELSGWAGPGRLRGKWEPVTVVEPPAVPVTGKAFPPVRRVETLPARSRTEPEPGRHVFDFGQNLVGVVRLRLSAPRGTRVVLRHAEMLEADGRLYVANLRGSRSTDVYVCRGGGPEIFTPRFTFHGFRYAEISGLPKAPALEEVAAEVWHTDLEKTGEFSCSDPLINQLQSNIRWSQRGNFLEVPTDCPQRDERLGWTGDAQVFAPTAAFNYDVSAFFRKWTRDLSDGQRASGAFPDVAPDVFFKLWPASEGGNAAWAEAGIICPWVMYRKYGDTRILAENYPAMIRYLGYLAKTSAGLIRPDTSYGDWLAPDAVRPQWAPTPCDLIGTAYFAHAAALVGEIARVLGLPAAARRHAALHRRVVAAFRRQYVTPEGRLAGDTQTAYLLALAFDLLPERLRPKVLGHLERALQRREHHLATGFVGTPLLCPVLARFGRADLAWRLIFNETYPSWLFPVRNGATTMWERWNSWTPDKGFGEVGMNSFNHYAYGAVGEWLYAAAGGIVELEPAFRRVLLRLEPAPRLDHAEASLECPYGRIRSAWRRAEGGCLAWKLELPPGTEGLVVPTAAELGAVKIDGRAWHRHPGAAPAGPHEGRAAFTLRAGRYELMMSVKRD